MRKVLCLASLCLGCGLGVSAGAQSAELPADEIIVTAQRQAQSKLSYAGEIDKIAAQVLSDISAVHPAEALNSAAGVNIQRGSGQEHLTAIRSPVLTGGAGAGSFLYLEDGVPLRATGFANVNGLFEAVSETAASIEVVKGPGSVLYGSNAEHGMINVLSPAADAPGGYVRALEGANDYIGLGASASTGKLRGNLWIAHDGGFRADSGYDQQKLQLRLDESLQSWEVSALASLVNLNQETAGFIRGPDAYKDPDVKYTNPNPEAYRDARAYRGYVRFERDINDQTRVQITPYGRFAEMDFLRHFVPGQAREQNGHYSAGVLTQVTGAAFTAGVDVELTEGWLDETQDSPTVFSYVQGPHYDYRVGNIVLGAYGQLNLPLGARGELTGGMRADYAAYDYDNKIDSGVFGRFRRVDDRRDDFVAISPKFGLSYALTPAVNAYGRAARGVRLPQAADLYSLQVNQMPGELKPETLDSFEAGLKGRRLGLTFDISAYRMLKNHYFFVDSNGFNVSDGKTSHTGLDVSVSYEAPKYLSLRGAAGYAHHNYEFSRSASSASSTITKGDRMDTAPSLTGQMTLTGHITPRWDTDIEWRHMGKYFTDPGHTASYPGHDVFVLRTRFDVSDKAQLMARIDNLLDTDYADRADFAFGTERYFPGRPRTLFVGLSFKR